MEELQTQTRNVGMEGHLGAVVTEGSSVQLHTSQLFPEAKTLKPGVDVIACAHEESFYFQMLANFSKNTVWVKKRDICAINLAPGRPCCWKTLHSSYYVAAE